MPRNDRWSTPFRRMVVLGESTVEGGGWIAEGSERWADIVAGLINDCQDEPMEYLNKGIGANAISPISPGYEASAKPSAIERYHADVIEQKPDLFVLCYGLNDMRAAMPVDAFIGEMRKIVTDVREACAPLIVLTTIYYMTGWLSYPPFDRGSRALTRVYNDAIAALAEEEGCLLADVWDAEGGADWVMNPDGVHANKVGNLLIAHRVFQTIATHCSGIASAVNRRDMSTHWSQDTMSAREKDGDPYDPWWEQRGA